MRKFVRACLLVAGNLGVVVLLLALLEGGASWLLVVRDAGHRDPPLAERLHTSHDAELGWVNLPGAHRPDMYGPGIGLTINAQGFRGLADTPPDPPPGRTRLVCSGDSFTLGYGVADSATWCHRLQLLEPRLEAVNMGQGGYGFDQAWLWYRRDGAPLRPAIHLLAFIADDFRRMEHGDFLGYPKPVVAIEGDTLAVRNIPVRSPGTGIGGWLRRWRTPLTDLRSVELVRRLRLRLGSDSDGARAAVDSAARWRVRPIVSRIVADLARRHADAGSHLLLVRLPTEYELDGFARDVADEWGELIEAEAARHGVGFVDLFPAFERLDPAQRSAMYLTDADVGLPEAAGHYTAAGNELVAHHLLQAITARGWLDSLPR